MKTPINALHPGAFIAMRELLKKLNSAHPDAYPSLLEQVPDVLAMSEGREDSELPGTLTISRPTRAGSLEHVFRIEIRDCLSRTTLLAAEISAEQFALALTAFSDRPMKYKLRPVYAGMKAEYQSAQVTVPKYEWEKREEVTEAAVANHPLTSEGWSGYSRDARNRHNLAKRHEDGSEVYKVSFTRFVPADPGDAKAIFAKQADDIAL